VTASGKDSVTLSGAKINISSNYSGSTVDVVVYKGSVSTSNEL
jgi:hypothetical protein